MPDISNRYIRQDVVKLPAYFRNSACRIVGTVKSKDHTCMGLAVFGPRDLIWVHAWNDGILDVLKDGAENPPDFPGQVPIRTKALHPGDQGNQVLVIVQERRLRVFVNDQQVGQPRDLPEGAVPTRYGIMADHYSGREARVEFTHFTLWDLDEAQPRAPAEAPPG
jgi:hypothetical protein